MFCESWFNIAEACAVPHIREDNIREGLKHALRTAVDLGSVDRVLVISDLHLGDGDVSDASVASRPALLHVLRHAREHRFMVILLGDVEELWKYNAETIINANPEVYAFFQQLEKEGHLIRIWGNHDALWEDPEKVKQYLSSHDQTAKACEAVKLQVNGCTTLLTHGHQGTYDENSCWATFSEWFLRSCWQCCYVKDCCCQTSATSASLRGVVEDLYSRFAFEHDIVLVTGHTHNAMIDLDNRCFVNTGSACQPDGSVDVLIIEKDSFTLQRCTSTFEWQTLASMKPHLSGTFVDIPLQLIIK